VKWQIMTAAGERLTLKQKDITISGHAVECRINAEDPWRGFMPSAGLVEFYLPPGGPGVRVDSHVYSGYRAPSNYDSLLGKIMTWGENRQEAIARMRRALMECHIVGPQTIIPFHLRILDDQAFLAGELHTELVQERLDEWLAEQTERPEGAEELPIAVRSVNGRVPQ
jgi:acetyl-CoA carboxylase, biotin carboxylase subunit